MQDITLTHANTFFFITTIAVSVGIILLLVLLFIFLRIFRAVKTVSARVEQIVDNTGKIIESSENSSIVQKGLPFMISVAGLFTKKKQEKKVTRK